MNEGKHTPGPWKFEPARERLAEWMIARGFATGHGDTLDALLAELSWQIEEVRQRAAAAPELLETVIAYRLHHKLMLNVTDDTDCPCKICQMAEAVIRKASIRGFRLICNFS